MVRYKNMTCSPPCRAVVTQAEVASAWSTGEQNATRTATTVTDRQQVTTRALEEVEKAEAIEWLLAVEERTNCDISDDKLLVINFCPGGAP